MNYRVFSEVIIKCLQFITNVFNIKIIYRQYLKAAKDIIQLKNIIEYRPHIGWKSMPYTGGQQIFFFFCCLAREYFKC